MLGLEKVLLIKRKNMGLDFNHSEAHWAYSGFNRFREKLANEIGICLPFMEGFWSQGDSSYSTVELTKRILGLKLFDEHFYWLPKTPLKWDNIKDPIVDLLYHSDCDGNLTTSQCRKIAPRIRELVKNWEEDDYDKKQAVLLAEGMEFCAKNRKILKFS